MFGLEKERSALTTFTIGIDEPQHIRERMNEAKDFPLLKVKLNGEQDEIMMETIRSVSNVAVAVDVNQGWKDKETAIKKIEWLSKLNVVFVEQPLKKEELEDAHWLFQRSPLPLYADESIQRITDIEFMKDCFHGINIKLMKCTGMNEAHQMILRARELQLKTLVGCMSESSCGVSAAAQLSPLIDHADLDGPLLIKNDPFEGITYDRGKILLNDKPGIGVSLL
jgi:L-alanine-DL-glutamate epimerase-like enolase superfamily enzyme